MSNRKRFFRSGHVGRHAVMYYGHFALPYAFGLTLNIAVPVLAFLFAVGVNSFVGVDPVLQLTVNITVLGLVGAVALYWLIVGIVRLVRITLAVNGGRIE